VKNECVQSNLCVRDRELAVRDWDGPPETCMLPAIATA
jgi:hypothetical protein